MKTLTYKLLIALWLIPVCITSCKMKQNKEELKKTIIDTEKKFEAMAYEKGIKEAFLFFADENAVLNRNGNILKGKPEISRYFEQNSEIYTSMTLKWNPDFIEVSESGDLAYTYGKYTASITDSTGSKKKSDGVFHTVWKLQANGTWKYVWD